MSEPCQFGTHVPPKPGQAWSACIFCDSPMAIEPEPMFWPRDVFAWLAEHPITEIQVTAEPDPDDDPDAEPVIVTERLSSGAWITLLFKLGDQLKDYELVPGWRWRELTEGE